MRRENGEIWLKPEEWIPWVWANHPERIRPAVAAPSTSRPEGTDIRKDVQSSPPMFGKRRSGGRR